jgi:hypothetical protein
MDGGLVASRWSGLRLFTLLLLSLGLHDDLQG